MGGLPSPLTPLIPNYEVTRLVLEDLNMQLN